MKRILLTGMSGTGKSSVIEELSRRGFTAIDFDYGYSERGPHGDWIWIEERVKNLLARDQSDYLFVSGCATNQGAFYEDFDEVFLLSAPRDVLAARLSARSNNSYGSNPAELAEVLHHLETVEPLLRRGASREIDTTRPLDEIVDQVLNLAVIKH